jgi:hypothetical protein
MLNYSNLEQRQPKNRKLYKLAKSFGIDSFHLSSKDPVKFCSNLKKIMMIDIFFILLITLSF